jgi:hypothetical protein
MITPQTHPHHFREEAVGPYRYFVPIYPSIGLDEDMQDVTYSAWREAYRHLCPAEIVEGKIDEKKYAAWNDEDRKGGRMVMRAVANLLFTPKDNAPQINTDDAWYMLTQEQLSNVKSFTKPKSQDSTSGLTISATNSSDSPASLNPPSAPLPS